MSEPKFKKGQYLRHKISGKEILIVNPIRQRLLVRKNIHVSGFSEEFIGTYSCTWFDDKGKPVSEEIDENLLSKPSDTET